MNHWPAQILILNSFFHATSRQKTDHFFKVQHVKTTMLEDIFFLNGNTFDRLPTYFGGVNACNMMNPQPESPIQNHQLK